jgi:hypothetical protein
MQAFAMGKTRSPTHTELNAVLSSSKIRVNVAKPKTMATFQRKELADQLMKEPVFEQTTIF